MYYSELKALSPITSDIVTYDAVAALFPTEQLENRPERKSLFWNCYLTVLLESGATVLLAPVDGTVDVRGYDHTRKMNWHSADLVGEALRVYPTVTDPEYLKEVERGFVSFLAKRAESTRQKNRASADKSLLPTPQTFDRQAVDGIISILEPEQASAALLLSNLEKAALTPGVFLAENDRLDAMSEHQCRAYTWLTEFLEGELHDRGRMIVIDWKASREDVVSSLKTLTGFNITLPKKPAQELGELLPLAGAQLRRGNLTLLEYITDADSHFLSAVERDSVATFRTLLERIGVETIDHSRRPRLFKRFGRKMA